MLIVLRGIWSSAQILSFSGPFGPFFILASLLFIYFFKMLNTVPILASFFTVNLISITCFVIAVSIMLNMILNLQYMLNLLLLWLIASFFFSHA